jgi:hypothetical protein
LTGSPPGNGGSRRQSGGGVRDRGGDQRGKRREQTAACRAAGIVLYNMNTIYTSLPQMQRNNVFIVSNTNTLKTVGGRSPDRGRCFQSAPRGSPRSIAINYIAFWFPERGWGDTSLGKAVEGHRSPRRFAFTSAMTLRASSLNCARPECAGTRPCIQRFACGTVPDT